MATQRQPSSKDGKNDMIECDYCGEVYSSTYRSCPFCQETRRSTRRSDSGGGGGNATPSGRRVAAKTTRGGGYGKTSQLQMILFIVVSLALIIGACFVVGKTIGPLLSRDSDDDEIDTSITTTVDPDETVETEEDTTLDVVIPDVVVPSVTAITLSHSDVTLGAGESFTITSTLSPADSDETVTWTSSSSSATVSLSGVVTNTNTGSSSVAVTITATAGDVTAECIVRCKAISSTSSSTDSVTSTDSATIYGASAGLNVRSGAGTSYDVIASLTNGTQVTILDNSTSGWYQISFYDGDGNQLTGYVSSDYVSTN